MRYMNVLIIGSGGREHAIGWKLKRSKQCGKIVFAPGNAGTAAIGKNVPLDYEPVSQKVVDRIQLLCHHEKIDLVVIGPEDPLSQGLADRLAKLGLKVFGPTSDGAAIEADKAYAKQLMRAAAIPTAESRTFEYLDGALAYVKAHETPVVVKAAGLAKGKGVVVCDDSAEAEAAVRRMMVDREFGEAGERVVVEERLAGQEVSILALVDGRDIYVLEPSQDHKAVGEGDTGPNTGGMGAYTPTPLIDAQTMSLIQREVLVPMVDVMRREGIDYRGVLYAGMMLTPGGPRVLEFNCRFGDPECQPLLVRLKGDLLAAMLAVVEGRLADVDLRWDRRVACCVVMCSGGYPGPYEKGKVITGIDDAEAMDDVWVFHAGTTTNAAGEVVTAGGRVLNVVALGEDLASARDRANAACDKIHFEGAFFRRDIGDRVLTGSSD
jgi:phosphoribosylamine--glycine ligase